MRKTQIAWQTWVGALSSVWLVGVAQAHHSFAMFDLTKCETIQGTVRNYVWEFPHTWIWLYVPDGKGGQEIWGFEGDPPSNLSEHGWKKSTLKKGDKVTLKYAPLKSGQKGGAFSRVTLPDGLSMTAPRGHQDDCSK